MKLKSRSLIQSSYFVQGVEIKCFADKYLSLLLSDYFRPFYHRERTQSTQPVRFEFCLVKEPVYVSADSAKAIVSPAVAVYGNGKKIYCSSKNGSVICLDPAIRKAKGFFTREIIRSPGELFSLLGASLVEILKCYGFYFLHASALYVNKVAYLFSGDGGSGKTTAALSMIREGFQYVSDDSLFLSDVKEEILISPMYTHFHIDEDLAKRFPEISKGRDRKIPKGTKVPVDVSKFFPGTFIPSLRPEVIIFPKIIPQETSTLKSLTQMEVYKRLLKQTILSVDNDISHDQLRILEKLVKQTRGFELLSGRDVYENPKILVGFLSEVNDRDDGNKEV